MVKTYVGEKIEVTFAERFCIHVAACLAGLPEVFDLYSRPWIRPDAVEPDRLAEVIGRCPSGALQFRRLDRESAERPLPQTTITPIANGPLFVRGDLKVQGTEAEVLHSYRFSLCRVHSKNKPFCDNSHGDVGFQAPGEAIHLQISPSFTAAMKDRE
jgi:uncharacterized Fe-S cluster protein YjdI/CDGSH-type Zn-finger protein